VVDDFSHYYEWFPPLLALQSPCDQALGAKEFMANRSMSHMCDD